MEKKEPRPPNILVMLSIPFFMLGSIITGLALWVFIFEMHEYGLMTLKLNYGFYVNAVIFGPGVLVLGSIVYLIGSLRSSID